MNKNSLLFCTLIFLLLIPAAGFGENRQALIEQMASGSINWSTATILSKGIGVPPQKSYGKPQARPLALRAARLDAMRNILEALQGVRIDSTTVVRNFATESDVILAKVEGMVKGAKVVHQEYMSDGTVEVTVEMSLLGGFSQLVLPSEIKQVEAVLPVQGAKTSKTAASTPTPSPFTGLVVDARGLKVKPAMAPKILDENGKEVYGSAYVSREYAVQIGMSGYTKDIKEANLNARVTNNPLAVKGLRADGPGSSNIVISNLDASRIRSTSENLSFLKKCRVLIVLD
jgi:hypothetical protein